MSVISVKEAAKLLGLRNYQTFISMYIMTNLIKVERTRNGSFVDRDEVMLLSTTNKQSKQELDDVNSDRQQVIEGIDIRIALMEAKLILTQDQLDDARRQIREGHEREEKLFRLCLVPRQK